MDLFKVGEGADKKELELCLEMFLDRWHGIAMWFKALLLPVFLVLCMPSKVLAQESLEVLSERSDFIEQNLAEGPEREHFQRARARIISKIDSGRTSRLGLLNLPSLSVLPPEISLLEIRDLEIGASQIEDISILAGQRGMGTFWLNESLVSDASVIAEMPNLRELVIYYSPIEDLSVLGELTGLQTVWLIGLPADDASDLRFSPLLTDLSIEGLPIEDISFLEDLTNLNRLFLTHTQVRDIGSLSSLQNLETLLLTYANIDSLEPLRGLARLNHLNLSGLTIDDLSFVDDLPALENLTLTDAEITDISALDGRALTYLSLRNTQVTQIDALRGMTSLTLLDLVNVPLDDLSVAADLANAGVRVRFPDGTDSDPIKMYVFRDGKLEINDIN